MSHEKRPSLVAELALLGRVPTHVIKLAADLEFDLSQAHARIAEMEKSRAALLALSRVDQAQHP